MSKQGEESLDVALLPLGDGRRVMLPLVALAEVQPHYAMQESDGGQRSLHWRGHELPVATLDELCGLVEPQRRSLSSIAVVRADRDSGAPFRALALSGTASHRRVRASELEPVERTVNAPYLGLTRTEDQEFLVPDLESLLYRH